MDEQVTAFGELGRKTLPDFECVYISQGLPYAGHENETQNLCVPALKKKAQLVVRCISRQLSILSYIPS